MKRFVLRILPFTLLLLAGCAQEPVGVTGPLVVSGRIQNWQASFGATLNAVGGPNEALGSTPVDTRGAFELALNPPFYTLGNLAPCQNNTSTLVSSPGSLRVSSVKLEIAEQAVSFVRRNLELGAPQEALYVYADQAGTVQGQVECVGRFTNTYRFNLALLKGWNLLLSDVQTVSDTSLIATYTSTTELDVAAFNWFAYVP